MSFTHYNRAPRNPYDPADVPDSPEPDPYLEQFEDVEPNPDHIPADLVAAR